MCHRFIGDTFRGRRRVRAPGDDQLLHAAARARGTRLRPAARTGSRATPGLLDIKSGERWQETLAWWLSYCDVAIVLLSSEALDSACVRYR